MKKKKTTRTPERMLQDHHRMFHASAALLLAAAASGKPASLRSPEEYLKSAFLRQQASRACYQQLEMLRRLR